jgi:hypothetical protein
MAISRCRAVSTVPNRRAAPNSWIAVPVAGSRSRTLKAATSRPLPSMTPLGPADRLAGGRSRRAARRAAPACGAGSHGERCDGSGYHRGSRTADLPLHAWLLVAADSYHAMREDRPHRAALSPRDAALDLRRESAAGRLPPEAVSAVLSAAGQPGPPASRPAGLSGRECEVLGLLAGGLGHQAGSPAGSASQPRPATITSRRSTARPASPAAPAQRCSPSSTGWRAPAGGRGLAGSPSPGRQPQRRQTNRHHG